GSLLADAESLTDRVPGRDLVGAHRESFARLASLLELSRERMRLLAWLGLQSEELARAPGVTAQLERRLVEVDDGIVRAHSEIAEILPDELLSHWNARLDAGLAEVRAPAGSPSRGIGGVGGEPALAEQPGGAVRALVATSEQVVALERFGETLAQSWDDEASASAADARRAAASMVALAAAVALVAIAMLVALTRSLVRPLTSLGADIARLAGGVAPGGPPDLLDPPEVATVGEHVRALAAQLETAQGQLAALAAGHLDDPVLGRNVAGPLGDQLAATVRQVARSTAELRASEDLSRAVIDTAADAIWILEADGTVRSANRSAAELLGTSVHGQRGRPFAELLADPALLDDLRANRPVRGEHELVGASGEIVAVRLAAQQVTSIGETVLAVFAQDIRSNKRLERQLTHQARHDVLTGLPNRAEAMRLVDKALARTSPADGAAEPADGAHVGLLFVDLDGFKRCNDTYGHDVGDLVLRTAAQRLRGAVRTADVVARLGGDEFVVVLGRVTSVDAARQLGERLIRQLEQPVEVEGVTTSLSASIGIAIADSDAVTAEDLLQCADAAVYAAKAGGKGRAVVYDDVLAEQLSRRRDVEQALRESLRGDGLQLYYQPVVDTETWQVSGAEALVRWRRRPDELLSPGDFVPVAEQSHLVLELDRWVLRQACAQLARWGDDPALAELSVSINISGRSLVSGRLIGEVGKAIEESGLDPARLQIELTETHLPEDPDAARAAVAGLRSLGVSVAVDDFGTGFTSIATLRTLAVDALKIDRSLVVGLDDDETLTLVRVLVTSADMLGLGVVAEGVETAQQMHRLGEIGCRHVQGFLLGEPAPPEVFARSVRNWHSHRDGALLGFAGPRRTTTAVVDLRSSGGAGGSGRVPAQG
ncbi:MAG: bifunctional diguanylate cyclase/phosphodiesterase, partial [Acidimicrobiia bacterium]|nr:bifunctional diguanylate cyclase/phosphodiesterase [Acidimicrobiia bacterium]